jgi:hypothetical protein
MGGATTGGIGPSSHARKGVFKAHELKIALIAPPFIAVPPADYGGTELFVAHLAEGLLQLGLEVVVYPMVNPPSTQSAAGSMTAQIGRSRTLRMPSSSV